MTNKQFQIHIPSELPKDFYKEVERNRQDRVRSLDKNRFLDTYKQSNLAKIFTILNISTEAERIHLIEHNPHAMILKDGLDPTHVLSLQNKIGYDSFEIEKSKFSDNAERLQTRLSSALHNSKVSIKGLVFSR